MPYREDTRFERESLDNLKPVPSEYNPVRAPVMPAYLIWSFLGFLGIHRFYLGATTSGLWMLFLSLVSMATAYMWVGLIGMTLIGIWVSVDFFLIPSLAMDARRRLNERLAKYD